MNLTQIQLEFIRWIIIRDSMTIVSMLSTIVLAFKVRKNIKTAAKERDYEMEFLGQACVALIIVCSFIFQQNAQGVVKAWITPRIFCEQYVGFGGEKAPK